MYTALVFLPIIASAIAGLLGRFIGARMCELVTTVALFVSAGLSIFAFWDVAILGHSQIITLAQWISSGDFQVDWAIRVDTLTAVMLVVVTGVSSLVHLYSIGYMHDDPAARVSSLICPSYLRDADVGHGEQLPAGVLRLGRGWAGVLSADRLLVQKPSANAAALKAFVVNRVGDFGFMLGILAIFTSSRRWISTRCSPPRLP